MTHGSVWSDENPSTLIVHPALAPYRIDLFNRLAELVPLQVVLLRDRVPYYGHFDTNALYQRLQCDFQILDRSIEVARRVVPYGLPRELKLRAPDVVVTSEFGITSLTVALSRVLRWSTERWRHLVWTAENPEIFRAKMTGPRAPIRRLLGSLIDGVIVYTASMQDVIRDQGIASNTYVCANLQSGPAFRDRTEAATGRAVELMRTHGLTEQKVLLYVGRLVENKGVGSLLRAAVSSLQSGSDFTLVVIGEGPLAPEVSEAGLSDPLRSRLIQTGHLQGLDLHAWYRLASGLVLPSWKEPFGAVVNEGLLAGLWVICSDRCGGRVLVDEDETGRYVTAGDVASLAAAISEWEGARAVSARDRVSSPLESRMRIAFRRDVEGMLAALLGASKPA